MKDKMSVTCEIKLNTCSQRDKFIAVSYNRIYISASFETYFNAGQGLKFGRAKIGKTF